MNELNMIEEQIRRFETKYQLALIKEAERDELQVIRKNLENLRKLRDSLSTYGPNP